MNGSGVRSWNLFNGGLKTKVVMGSELNGCAETFRWPDGNDRAHPGRKAGHLELLKGGKKNKDKKDGEVKKGGTRKFG